jgi:hypothetical protein
MSKLTQKPGMSFTRREKRVSLPSRWRTMAAISGISEFEGGGSTLSSGSSVRMRMPSFDTSSNSSSVRRSGAEWVSAALVRVTTDTSSSAVCSACGPRWNTLIMPIHDAIDRPVRKESSRKVRQNRPLFMRPNRRLRGVSDIGWELDADTETDT